MTGRYCFHRCLSVNISVGWGVGGGVYPILGLGRGVPHLRSRGYPMSGGGTPCPGRPHPRSGWGGERAIPAWGGYPISGWGGTLGTPPTEIWDGVPPYLRWGTPPLQSSIASTCYAAGGVPLAFTQKDFLVFTLI